MSESKPLPSRMLDVLQDDVELEGYEPGSDAYKRVLLERRVRKCQELQGVAECQNCRAFLNCNYAHEFLIARKYGGK